MARRAALSGLGFAAYAVSRIALSFALHHYQVSLQLQLGWCVAVAEGSRAHNQRAMNAAQGEAGRGLYAVRFLLPLGWRSASVGCKGGSDPNAKEVGSSQLLAEELGRSSLGGSAGREGNEGDEGEGRRASMINCNSGRVNDSACSGERRPDDGGRGGGRG